MGDYGLTQEELEICTVEFNNCLASIDDEKERTWMTYEECKLALMKILEREFIWDYVFYKVLSEIRGAEPNRIRFDDFISLYKK